VSESEGVLAVVYERKVHPGLLLDGRGNGIQAAIAGGRALDRAAAAGDDDIAVMLPSEFWMKCASGTLSGWVWLR